MPSKKISQLAAASTLDGTEKIAATQSAETRSILTSEFMGRAENNAKGRSALFPAALECRLSEEAYYDISIETVVPGNNEVRHPSVLFIPEGFGGHQWWMAICPHPISLGGDYLTWENPSIFCSDDGVNWAPPTGLTNPIAPDPNPGGTGNNADTHLVLSADRRTMYCAWLEDTDGTTEKIVIKSSVDGVTWSDSTTLLSVTKASERILSPQLSWDAENSRWMLHVVDTVPANNVLNYCVRADLDGTFGARTQCTYTLPDSETDVWHVDVRRLPTGRWFGLMGPDASGGKHQQYPMESADGITWHFGPKLSERLGYKSSFVPVDAYAGLMYWGLADGPDWHIELAGIRFDQRLQAMTRTVYEQTAAAGAAAKQGVFYLEDSFARADEAPIATADSGESWTATAGQFNVVSNQMVANASGNNIATVDVGFTEAEITVEFSSLSTSYAYAVVRLSASTDFHRIGISVTSLRFQRVGGAGLEVLRQVTVDNTSAKKLRVVCTSTKYHIYVDDTYMFTIDDSDHETNTRFGVQATETGTKIDRVIVSRLS